MEQALRKLISACDVALHSRMYRDWPIVAQMLIDAIKEGEAALTHWNAPESLPADRDNEIRDLVAKRRAMESSLEIYRKLAADYRRAEEKILGHYPASARPGPFICEGMVIEVLDKDSDHEWRFEFTAAIVVPKID